MILANHEQPLLKGLIDLPMPPIFYAMAVGMHQNSREQKSKICQCKLKKSAGKGKATGNILEP